MIEPTELDTKIRRYMLINNFDGNDRWKFVKPHPSIKFIVQDMMKELIERGKR